MNETIMNLTTRRSIRRFKSEQIKDEELKLILEAGKYAPTGQGKQSPVMVVLQKQDDVRYLSRLNGRVMGNEDFDPFYGAPTVIIVLADKNRTTYIEDGSLVIGNLLNAAHSIDVDSCWIHRAREVFESPEGKELLKKWGLPDYLEGIGNCILGYRDCEYPDPIPRKENYVVIP